MITGNKIKTKILPFPDNKDFAVSFIDDTDLSTKENTEPVYEFLNSKNIKGTKTVWMSKQKRSSAFRKDDEKTVDSDIQSGSTLENKDYLDFIVDLKGKGFEIALHGIAAGNSYRNEIRVGIDKYKKIFGEYPKINVFHKKNIENLYAGSYKLDFWPFKILEKITENSNYLGHVPDSPYFWGDIAKDRIKYMRLPFHTISEVNTLKVNPNMPFQDPKRPYVNYWFSSSDGSNCQRFKTLLSNNNLKKLERENGVCLIYTHFAKGFACKKNGRYELDKEFVEVVSRLSGYHNAWFPTASELLDRLLDCKMISVKQLDDTVLIKNSGDKNIKNLTIKIDPNLQFIDEKDSKYSVFSQGRITIDNLPAGSTLSFKVNQKGNFELRRENQQYISKWERIKIEFYNYYGLLKQEILGNFNKVK